jgi:formylglycine-generating enzyme required for sulfatase activity
MKTKHTSAKGPFFAPAFFLFSLVLFFFTACPQPQDGDTGTGPEPPAAPAMPLVSPGNGRLILSWTAVPGADSYEVFCGEAGGETEPGPAALPEPEQTVNVPAAVISGLENGTSYSVWLRAKNAAGLSGFSPAAAGTPAVQLPAPSLVRGDGELAIGWAAEDGVSYEVRYGEANSAAEADAWAGPINISGITAGTTISGLDNGTPYYVWIKTADGETGGFGPAAAETPEAPPETAGGGFIYIPGGTITGSNAYAFTLTVPSDPPGYTGAGTTSIRKGVFVEDRRAALASFVMAQHETTQELWYTVQSWALEKGYQFQNKKNSPPEDGKNKPVTRVSWRDAVVWCNAYSEKMGREPVYYYPAVSQANILRDSRNANAAACNGVLMDKTKNGYRLPTEAEREFSARGGNPGLADWMYMYAGSNNADEVAWHHGNAAFEIQTVGTKAANRLGVYDLSGNVQEWCWDWMNWAVDVTTAIPGDGADYSGTAPLANQKPFNGGGTGSNITMSSVAYRWGYAPDYTNEYVGFRVVHKP